MCLTHGPRRFDFDEVNLADLSEIQYMDREDVVHWAGGGSRSAMDRTRRVAAAR